MSLHQPLVSAAGNGTVHNIILCACMYNGTLLCTIYWKRCFKSYKNSISVKC